ncbi:uncharacterized protein KRP23_7697 [Phytophthora ramorum]|uniref:uncharacterized protein n=1 Tax=Phytophthora ramorum TaxID=164328 RepID=UPI003098C367|nr:hypothetical protein KRP23_7697 [Phytophthora ramorum]
MAQTWHWQERFDPADVEDACRQQILKIRKSVPYELWLKKKARVSKGTCEKAVDYTAEDNKQEEVDAAFQDWLRRKRKQARSAKKQKQQAAPEKDKAESKPWRKPPSLHVNPKTEGKTRKVEHAEPRMSKSSSATYIQRGRSEVENQHAYAVWMERVRQEDQIRRAQCQEELKRLEQQQREKHKVTWRKKLAVCAYSTLVVDD